MFGLMLKSTHKRLVRRLDTRLSEQTMDAYRSKIKVDNLDQEIKYLRADLIKAQKNDGRDKKGRYKKVKKVKIVK